ncbi:hypothetical protein EV424DRAFT_681037 [Suillus variegatus]|nr:hypothetical protein EV424DRAFT_681037 [Suillus variegatus]
MQQTDSITPDTLLPSWVSTTKLVAKPDHLIKRRTSVEAKQACSLSTKTGKTRRNGSKMEQGNLV